MADLHLKNISKKYDNGFVAVKNFDLTVNDKEFIIFVGPSGCGKTTILRMIAGLEEISDGELFIDGEVMNHVSPKNRDIAMVFQNYALYPHMSVYDNIAFGLKIRKTSKSEINNKVNAAAKILDISDLLNRKPKTLSGGQRQRVAMGRAIVRNPKVFLMDEPLSNLDAMLRTQMRTEIAKLHRQLQATIIYVTHDQTEAMTLGTRIVVMKDGIIQQTDTPERLYKNPLNMFVAGFIGTQMNFFEMDTVRENNGIILKNKAIEIKLPEGKKGAIKPYIGKKVIVGLRPEAIHISNGSAVLAEVEMIERLGEETSLYLNLSGISIVAKTNEDTGIQIGDKVGIEVDHKKIHIFDKETELAIKGESD